MRGCLVQCLEISEQKCDIGVLNFNISELSAICHYRSSYNFTFTVTFLTKIFQSIIYEQVFR